MSSNTQDPMVGNRPLSSLRVVDLKQELEKRGLSKSGSKKELADRLRLHLQIEKHRGEGASADEEELPNYSVHEELADQNPFIRDYLASQAELFHSQKVVKKLVEEEAKRESETSADEGVDSPVKQTPAPVEKEETTPVTEPRRVSRRRGDSGRDEMTMTAEKLVTRSSRSRSPAAATAPTPVTESEMKNNNVEVEKEKESPKKEEKKKPDVITPTEKPEEAVPEPPPLKSPKKLLKSSEPEPPDEKLVAKKVENEPKPSSEPKDAEPSIEPKEVESIKKSKDAEPIKKSKDAEALKKSKEVEPIETSKGVQPIEKAKDVEPVKKSKEVEPIKKSKEVEPIEKSEVVEPVKKSEEVEPIEKIKGVQTIEKIKGVQTIEKIKGVQTIEKIKGVQTIEKSKDVQPIEKSKVVQPTKELKRVESSKEPEEVVSSKDTKSEAAVVKTKVEAVKKDEVKVSVPRSEAVSKSPSSSPAPVEAKPDEMEVDAPKADVSVEEEKMDVDEVEVNPKQKDGQRSRSSSPPVKKSSAPETKGAVIHDKKHSSKEKGDESASSADERRSRSLERSKSRSVSRSRSRSRSASRSKSRSRSRSRSVDSREDSTSAVEKRSEPEENDEESREGEQSSVNKTPIKVRRSQSRSVSRSPVREKSPAPEKQEVVKKDHDVNGESAEATAEEKPAQVGDNKKDESTKSPRYKSSQKETYTKYDLAGEEALDYGEEEDDEDRNEHDPQEFSWTRRSLRLKNKTTTSASTCKWKVEEESKLLVVKSELLNKYYEDIKLVPLEQLKLEEKALSGSDTKVEISRKPSISQEPEQEEPLPTRTVENIPTIKRTVSIVSTTKTHIEQLDDAEKQLTPPRNPPSSVLLITNLVRPFTLPQLKEMLQRTGNLVDIWVDKIKSKCIAKFDSQEEAFETRAALHGVCWPSSNPKSLHVDYTSIDNLDDHKAKEGADQNSVSEKPMSAQPLPVREWDVGKKAEPKSPRNRKRSRSRSNSRDRDRAKRSRRSSSPGRRRHSRSPGHADRRHIGRGGGEGKEPEPMGKALDELFRKTVATPSIYWLPLTPEQIAEKEELRRKRMEERERRLAELSKMRPR